MNPLISIIIPTYNSALFFEECLNSVAKQTYNNLEVIIVDGNSTDTTQMIAKKYCRLHKNWKLVTTTKGVSHQRNIGLSIFKGEYLFFLDSDDFISSNLIEDLYFKLVNNNLDLVTPEVHNIFLKNNVLISTNIIEPVIIPIVTQNNFFSEAYNSFLGGPTKLYKRELVEGLQYDESMSNGEDVLFNYSIVKNKAIKYDSCKGAIYYYRHDVTTKNPANKRLNKSGYIFCDKMVDILKSIKERDKNYYGALKILDIQLLLFMKSYLSSRKFIPRCLRRARFYMFKNTKRKFRYYYLFPRSFNVINALIH